jgi:hypothetical protein
MTPDRDAAGPEPAPLEPAPGEHVLVFLPPALRPPGWRRRRWHRLLVPGLWGLFTACEWAEGTLPPGSRVIAGQRSYPAPLLAGLVRDNLGFPVSLERTSVRVGPGRLVPCYLVRGKMSGPLNGPVTALVDGRLLARGAARPARAYLEYSERDPYAVWARFRAGRPGAPAEIDVECAFTRDLLSAGLTVESGQGDVRVVPRGRALVIELFTSAGMMRFTGPPAEIRKFLKETQARVPPGTEARHVDLDAGIARLLAGGAP